MKFSDRLDASLKLCELLKGRSDQNTCLLALPRGGVPLAADLSKRLKIPWDIVLVKKISAPYHPEFALGAISEDAQPVWNEEALSLLGVGKDQLQELVAKAKGQVKEQNRKWRQEQRSLSIENKHVIIVDDGISTGTTMLAAIHVVRQRGAKRVTAAAPVASPGSVAALRRIADNVVVVQTPEPFFSVGQWYENFDPVSDEQVMKLLSGRERRPSVQEVSIPMNGVKLAGELRHVSASRGLIIFAHGSGSSHKSPRNQAVSKALNQFGFSTLLFNLLTPEESRVRANTFDIDLISSRLSLATRWARQQPAIGELQIGYFGASTGAAAALKAAAEDSEIASVVSRGGRPDLVDDVLGNVRCPVLLIVGSQDHGVVELNQKAKKDLQRGAIVLIPGATHLFEEPGALDEVVQDAAEWFLGTIPQNKFRRVGASRNDSL